MLTRPTVASLRSELKKSLAMLDKRARQYRTLDDYYEGECPLPRAVVQARVTRAYKMLMGLSQAPWGSLIVDSVEDRLAPSGIASADNSESDLKALWRLWQANSMDSESMLAHNSALIGGRAFALVWNDPDTGTPAVWLDNATKMIVRYQDGSRRRRVSATRRWIDDDNVPHAVLYRPDGLFKFQAPKDGGGGEASNWTRELVAGEDWPIPNPLGVVPAIELPVNRRLKGTSYGFARGEYQHCLSLIDRINLLTFLGLVVAFWQGFPARGIVGEEIRRRVLLDDDNKPILGDDGEEKSVIEPVVEPAVDSIFQLEDPAAKVVEWAAADRNRLAVYPELDHLSTITHTPRHYFPMSGGMSNVSADGIRADEGGLNAKTTKHKGSLGEGWEEVVRLLGRLSDSAIELAPGAELVWADRQSRSLAEQADAAGKLKDVLPWQALGRLVLGLTEDQISTIEQERAGDPLAAIVAGLNAQPPSAGVPTNGNVPAPAPVA